MSDARDYGPYDGRLYQVAWGADSTLRERQELALQVIRTFINAEAAARPDADMLSLVFQVAEPLLVAEVARAAAQEDTK